MHDHNGREDTVYLQGSYISTILVQHRPFLIRTCLRDLNKLEKNARSVVRWPRKENESNKYPVLTNATSTSVWPSSQTKSPAPYSKGHDSKIHAELAQLRLWYVVYPWHDSDRFKHRGGDVLEGSRHDGVLCLLFSSRG